MLAQDLFSIILVGAFWGCTNPILRKGAADDDVVADKENVNNINSSNSSSQEGRTKTESQQSSTTPSLVSTVLSSLQKFRRFQVWVPYLFNQCGSLLFYYLLANSDLTVAVPVCNALALVFSIITSYYLGERLDKPMRAMVGAALVTGGVAICIASSSSTTTTDEEIENESILPKSEL